MDRRVDNYVGKQSDGLIRRRERKLFLMVGRVIKTLNMSAARQISFWGCSKNYGFDRSMNHFRTIVHIFALAGMQNEVFIFLRDIVYYYRDWNLDMSCLFIDLLDSTNDATSLSLLAGVLIKVFASNSMLENAVGVFRQSKERGLMPNIFSCNFLLKCLAQAGMVEYMFSLFDEMGNTGPTPCVYTYTIIMSYYCKRETVNMETSTTILEVMEKSGIEPSVVTYCVYVSGLCRAGGHELALDYIRGLGCRNEPLNTYCFNAVIRSFCEKGKLDEAWRVLEEMKSCGVPPDLGSYSVLIDGFCRNRNLEKGFALIKDMECTGIKPSPICYSAIVVALCNIGHTDTLVNIFYNPDNCGYNFDYHSYDILIRMCCVQGDSEYDPKLMEEMMRNNWTPNRSFIVDTCKFVLEKATLDFFKIMEEVGVQPDIVTCNSVTLRYCNEGRLKEALQFLDEMYDRDIIPNKYTYNEVINRLCKEGEPGRALQIVALMIKRNVSLGVVLYGTLLDGYAKKLDHEEVFRLHEKMLQTGITPDRVTYTILIQTYSARREMRKARKLLNDMIIKGMNPDTVTYTSVISGFSKFGDMTEAFKIFTEMSQRGHAPSVVTYTCLIDGYCKAQRIDDADMLVDVMRRKKIALDSVTYRILIDSYYVLGKRILSFSLVNFLSSIRYFAPNAENQILETQRPKISHSHTMPAQEMPSYPEFTAFLLGHWYVFLLNRLLSCFI
ncbi:Pentatricopeptide repeat-containing protein [Heracleum sosnowskyi]|uniref:Pentatricopeptide repeat-containing protein n=1 Tax=Heracleum sosnowskyi TaxID=360622 RepID=A0AAD8M5N5_9APIA|nr:Pentatricopeptide repeat-containing protein [Heracleum sosnowskyi]